MIKAYRHGEQLLKVIDSIPESVEKLKTKLFATGSHGNHHEIDNGTLYKDENGFYLKAKNTSLLHPEHSPKVGDAKILDGNYQIIVQTEYTPEGLVPVVD
mgnify:CR=1 FL=1|jgi:hypothetical protein